MRDLCAVGIAVFGAVVTVASGAFGGPAQQVASPLVRTGESDGVLTPLSLEPALYEQVQGLNSFSINSFVLGPDLEVTLDVERFEILDKDALIVVGDDADAMARPDLVLLRGSVSEHEGSHVFVGLSPYGSNGYVELDGHTYIIADARFSEHETVVYDLTTLDPELMPVIDAVCGTDRLPVLRPAIPGLAPAGDPPCRIAKIAVDTDWEFTSFLFGGSTQASAAYAMTLTGAVSEIYAANFNTHFNITFLRVWAANNDPYGSLDGFEELDTLRDHWEATMGGVDRHTVHLLSGKQFNNLGGVAYQPGLCQNSFGYGLSGYINGFFPYPIQDHSPQNWDLMVVGHEVGHNFGAPHTHDQNPPLDGCAFGDCGQAFGATIMSYCHICNGGLANIAMKFADQTINKYVLPYLGGVACPLVALAVSIDEQPQDASACEGEDLTLSVAVSGTGPIAFQWFKDGDEIVGATEAELAIEDVSPGDAGMYFVYATNGCSDALSDAATVTVGAGCQADLNGDCALDVLDFVEMQMLFVAGDDAADINGDGSLSILDFVAYQLLFVGGC